MWEHDSRKISVDVDMLCAVHESHIISTGDGPEAATAVELNLSSGIPEPPPLHLLGLQVAHSYCLLLQLDDLHTQNSSGIKTSSIH